MLTNVLRSLFGSKLTSMTCTSKPEQHILSIIYVLLCCKFASASFIMEPIEVDHPFEAMAEGQLGELIYSISESYGSNTEYLV